MNKFCYWWTNIDWDGLYMVVIVLSVLAFTGILASISVSLDRIERNFAIVQELQKEVKRLDKLTECLEPAREIPSGPERVQGP